MAEAKDSAYLGHILEAIAKITRYTTGRSLQDLQTDDMFLDAVVRELEIIGEAASNLSLSFREAHPDLPWYQAIGMRNQLIHGYFEVDREVVWQTVTEDLTNLHEQLRRLI